MVQRTNPPNRQPVEHGVIGGTVIALIKGIIALIFTLVLAVTLEWAGMAWWWKDQGTEHSRAMLENEVTYLNEQFRDSGIVTGSAHFAAKMSDRFFSVFQWTHLDEVAQWLKQPAPAQPPQAIGERIKERWRQILKGFADHLIAAMTITQVFAVRLAILMMALPAFVLFALVGLSDGLVQRDLRRWGGGRESSFVYHHAKKVVLPMFIGVWVVYLGMPVSVNPSFIIVPFAALFGASLAITAATFKKYL